MSTSHIKWKCVYEAHSLFFLLFKMNAPQPFKRSFRLCNTNTYINLNFSLETAKNEKTIGAESDRDTAPTQTRQTRRYDAHDLYFYVFELRGLCSRHYSHLVLCLRSVCASYPNLILTIH